MRSALGSYRLDSATCMLNGCMSTRRTARVASTVTYSCPKNGTWYSAGIEASPATKAILQDETELQHACIVWFKKDLRMDDHPGLLAAAASGVRVIPLFVFDPVVFKGWTYDLLSTLLDAVADLRSSLQQVGSDLVIRIGNVGDVLVSLAQTVSITHVFTEEEVEYDLKCLVSNTRSVLSRHCRQPHVLETWDTPLYCREAYQYTSDDYRSFKAMNHFIRQPKEAPRRLPSLPKGVHRGRLPSILDIEKFTCSSLGYVRAYSTDEKLSQLLMKAKLGQSNGQTSWFKLYMSRLTMHPRAQRSSSMDGLTAVSMLDGYLQFPRQSGRGNLWRMLHSRMEELQSVSSNVFRPVFGTALILGRISLRRIYHEAKAQSKLRWFSSHVTEAAMEEVKLMEWYKLLCQNESGSLNTGLDVRTWKWRGFIIQYSYRGDKGPAMLLIHGFGAFWQHYRSNIKEISDQGNRVWALTMLGFGRSEKPGIVYTELLWAELIRDFIVDIIEEPTVLVGNSLGGYIACLVGSLWPFLVPSMVLINSAGRVTPKYDSFDNVYKEATKKQRVPQATLQILLYFLQQQCAGVFKRCYPANPGRVDNLILEEAMRASYDPGATSVLRSMFYLRLPLPLNFLLNCYSGKALVIQGIFDPLQNAFKKAMALQSCCKNVSVRILNAGHCPHDEVPEEVNTFIGEWMKTITTNLKSNCTVEDRKVQIEK